MFRLRKYKNYIVATNLLVIAYSITIAIYVILLLSKKHLKSFEFIFIFTSILSIFSLTFILVNKSNKIYKDDIIQILSTYLFGGRKWNLLFRIKDLKFPILSNSARKQEKNLLIISDENFVNKFVKRIEENNSRIRFKKHVRNEDANRIILDKIIKSENINEILVSGNNICHEELIRLIDLCSEYKVNIKLYSDLFKIIPQKINAEKYYDIPVLNFTMPIKGVAYLKLKRTIDILLSLSGIIFLTPILLSIMVSIKITSKGPIFYKQKRVGLNGELFDIYKFRSMYYENTEDRKREIMMMDFMKSNKTNKIIDNSRVTNVGKIIRKTSFDELPQLFNVLKGNMSIVGPRPCLPYEFDNYTTWQKRRVNVLPGCTGVWQVSGRGLVYFNDSILMDLIYLYNMSPLYDILLILKTFPVIFLSKGE
jgi:lipopolysaccharide/colanic/teichoic acid biosynthesis glycosyltransferase